MPSPHVVLLGDSVFDNRAYVSGPDVIAQVEASLKERAGPDGRATLCAVDGSLCQHVEQQLKRVPAGATHLVVSTGGNDMLGKRYQVENAQLSNGQEALLYLSQTSEKFERSYRSMLDNVCALGLPVTVVVPYYPFYQPGPELSAVRVGHGMFVDVMLREAFRRGLPVIDLRSVFTRPEDWANPIEPSVVGGQKLANLITEVVRHHDFGRKLTAVFAHEWKPAEQV